MELICIEDFYMTSGRVAFSKDQTYECISYDKSSQKTILIENDGDDHTMSLHLIRKYFHTESNVILELMGEFGKEYV